MPLIDLSVPLGGPEMSYVGGHPEVEKQPLNTHAVDGRSNTRLSFSIHTATHVDAPFHFHAGGRTIDQMPLEKYWGKAVLCDLRNQVKDNEAILVDHIKAALHPGLAIADRIVVVFTGHMEKYWGTLGFYRENSYLHPDTSRWFVAQKVRAVAIDTSVDKVPPGQTPNHQDCPNHRILLGAEVPLIENLVNLDRLPTDREFELWALPIKVYGGDGAPARAVAIV